MSDAILSNFTYPPNPDALSKDTDTQLTSLIKPLLLVPAKLRLKSSHKETEINPYPKKT